MQAHIYVGLSTFVIFACHVGWKIPNGLFEGFLAILYLHLGYFIVLLLPLGALVAVLVTRRQRAGTSPFWSSVATIVAYCAE